MLKLIRGGRRGRKRGAGRRDWVRAGGCYIEKEKRRRIDGGREGEGDET